MNRNPQAHQWVTALGQIRYLQLLGQIAVKVVVAQFRAAASRQMARLDLSGVEKAWYASPATSSWSTTSR
jgi:hypothetical protein